MPGNGEIGGGSFKVECTSYSDAQKTKKNAKSTFMDEVAYPITVTFHFPGGDKQFVINKQSDTLTFDWTP